MPRIEYKPNPIIPRDAEGLQTYLQKELEAIARVVATFNVTGALNEEADPDANPPIGYSHESTIGRGNADQHPIAAITGLQLALDEAGIQMFFQETQPTDLESAEGDIWFESGWE